jgi:hypothetical protein
MEIHAPEKPILTIKEAVVHLSIVTVGILIALSLEGIVEWRHHRSLIREARENIAAEIQDNRKELQKTMDRFDFMYKHMADAAEKVDVMTTAWDPATAASLFDARGGPGNITYRYYVADLRDASHATAQSTGALGYMDYSEVKNYADVYGFQNDYLRGQTSAANAAIESASLGLVLLKKPAPQDVDAVRRQLRIAMGNLMMERTLGFQLMKAYNRALGDTPAAK